MFSSNPSKKPKRKLGIFIFLACIFLLALLIYISVKLYFPIKYMDFIYQYADEYGLNPAFVCAVIHAESKFDADAVSNRGASGLMQLTEPTAVWLAESLVLKNPDLEDFVYEDVFDPETNIQLGCYYLNLLLKKYDYNYECALAAYNAGSGNVDSWLKNPSYSKDGKTLDYIPFKETRDFVRRVEFNTKVYEFLL